MNRIVNYIKEEEFKFNPDFKKHPSLGVWCHREGEIYSAKTGKPRKCFSLRNRKDGYLELSVKRSSYLAHRIIAEAWIPNPNNKPKVNHKNGVKRDNRVSNLEWVTQRENIIHARDELGVKFGISGFNSPNAKASEKDVRIMIRLWKSGFTQQQIGEILELSLNTVRRHLERHRLG